MLARDPGARFLCVLQPTALLALSQQPAEYLALLRQLHALQKATSEAGRTVVAVPDEGDATVCLARPILGIGVPVFAVSHADRSVYVEIRGPDGTVESYFAGIELPDDGDRSLLALHRKLDSLELDSTRAHEAGLVAEDLGRNAESAFCAAPMSEAIAARPHFAALE